MPHNFSIDKKSGIILVTGCGLLAVLLFIAGFLLGIQFQFSLRPSNLVAQSSSTKATQARLKVPAKPATPKTPNVAATATSAAPMLLAAAPASRQSAVGAQTEAKTSSATPEKQVVGPAGAANQPAAASPATSSPPAPAPATPQAAPSSAEVAAAKPAAQSTDEGKYSIQVGAFLNAKNAARLVKNLKARGYQAKEFIATDSRYRVWHTVRIGSFKDMEAAAQEARRFTQSAHLMALVRPADSL